MVGGCCVCSDERGWTENPLVYCDGQGCNVAVHQDNFVHLIHNRLVLHLAGTLLPAGFVREMLFIMFGSTYCRRYCPPERHSGKRWS
ncbi:hypothetical protein TNCV_4495181 [Trichonephila clavipes]|nr:hypothetical protein TNCV_4495181 [Trichonephila clavipes]